MGSCFSKDARSGVEVAPSKAEHFESKPAQAALAPSGQDESPAQAQVQEAVQVPNGHAEGDEPAEQESSEPYPGAMAPVCEINRRQHLLDLNIMHTEPEPRFDDITKLASMVFKVPIALVSLVDEKIQWFKSVQGLPVDNTPHNTSFCAWTLLPAYPEALVVEDAQQDARFKENPLVTGAPFIRFYAGCPLVCSNGMRLGSLCIIDKIPRSFDAESCNMLANMAEMVIREIERDKVLQEQRLQQERKDEEHKQLLRAIDCFNDAIMMIDMSSDAWSVVFANEAWEKLVGCPRSPGGQLPFWDIFQLPPTNTSSGLHMQSEFLAAVAQQQNFELLLTFVPPHQQRSSCNQSCQPVQYASAQFRCAANTGLDSHMPLIGIPNFLPNSEAASQFYFATLKPVQQRNSSSSEQQQGNGSCQVVRSGVPRAPHFSIMHSDEPFQDIKLGPLLGKGAFGRVYRGVWANTVVAVKVIEYSQEQNKDGRLLEGLLSEQVQHPNVVRTYKHMTRPLVMASNEEDEEPDSEGLSRTSSMASRNKGLLETWLLLEFCNRGSVSDAVDKGWFRKRSGTCEPNMCAILATAREVASALCYLHSRNILHGDLTGNNVLLTASPSDKQRPFTAKVSDFGLSRLLTNDAPIIETRTYGTVTHMPPELLLMGQMSRAVDVYSFGVVCWEMYCGHRPYRGMSHSQVLHSVGQSGAALSLPPGTPPAFDQFVAACLSRDPSKRPSMDQVLRQLKELEAALPPDGPPPL